MEEALEDFGKVIIRTPLYSYRSLFEPEGSTKNLDDLVLARLNDPVFWEGLYWSSPQLFKQVIKLREGGLREPKKNKLMYTLKKYLVRASTRCTPYGIYAGTGITDIDAKRSKREPTMERKVRIDMALMQNIKSRIESDPEIYPHLLYAINNSLYSIPGQYRFMETITENGKCHYQLSSLERTALLEKIIELAANKMVSIDDIYELTGKDAIYEQFSEFINELIKSQFLVSELQLGLTIENDLARYAGVLQRLKGNGISVVRKYLGLFSFIEKILSEFEKLPIGTLPLEEINELKQLLDECGIETFQDHLFHADLKKAVGGESVFSGEMVKEIKKGIAVLGKLSDSSSPFEKQMKCFKSLFLEKYGTQEVPLSEALDPEFGIGFPPNERLGDRAFNPMLEKTTLALGNKKADRNCQFWLQDKTGTLQGPPKQLEILLDDEDLKYFEDKICRLPPVFSVLGTLLLSGKILLESVGRAHANSLMGRFAYLDRKIENLCKKTIDREQQNNREVIFAEIVFVPEGRAGNVTQRQALTEYEIPFLASPGVTREKLVPVNDLMVSVQKDQIILRSKKITQRIIPRLSNAHNYINSEVPVYKFLSSIQYQDNQGFNITWGTFASRKRFLPRISYKNIIVHRASWFLQEEDIRAIMEASDSQGKLRAFFLMWKIPRFVAFAEGDNELFIDTAGDSYLELLLEEMKTCNLVKLVESPFDNPPENSYKDAVSLRQFILPLAQKNMTPIMPVRKPEKVQKVTRTFVPGSEWVYFKIYCGSTTSDSILLQIVKPAIDSLLAEGVIKKAFFIRYTDPHYHIRFRLHLTDEVPKNHLAAGLKCVYELVHPLSANRMVWKLQMCTYRREIERYGEDGILASEVLFFQDSLLYLSCLQHEEFRENDKTRLFSAIKNIDKWLSLFNMPLEEKAAYCLKMCNGLAKEYTSEVRLQFDTKYRELGNLLPSFLDSAAFDVEFNERDKKLKKMVLAKKTSQVTFT